MKFEIIRLLINNIIIITHFFLKIRIIDLVVDNFSPYRIYNEFEFSNIIKWFYDWYEWYEWYEK